MATTIQATRKRKGRATTGRRAGGHNKGYWYRKGRRWYVSEGRNMVALTTEVGDHLKAPDTPDETLQDAYARHILGMQEKTKRDATGTQTPLEIVCRALGSRWKSSAYTTVVRRRT
jgi:hypothetical protein